jgi:hypothetical protein
VGGLRAPPAALARRGMMIALPPDNQGAITRIDYPRT